MQNLLRELVFVTLMAILWASVMSVFYLALGD
jgi:hypothetical protein